MADAEKEISGDSLDVNDLVKDYTEALPLNSWLKVAVKEPTRKTTTTLKITDTYVAYLVETKIQDRSKIFSGWLDEDTDNDSFPEVLNVWRRYSEFDLLRDYLLVTFPSIVLPPLPEKRTTSAWQAAVADKTDPEFLERRRLYLEQFMKRLTKLSEISQDPILLNFMKDEAEWKDSVNNSKYRAQKDSWLKALSAGYRIKRPNEKFEAIKRYANELEAHIGNVLKVRAKTTEHLYGVHKIHANYGREFSEWSSIERKDMAEGLQKMGHYMDTFSQDIDVCIEGEEDFADQLKEYHGYCESLRHICKKQELLQLELEQCEDALESRKTERENLSLGKTGLLGGLRAKVFGGGTAEQKEEKLKQLDNQILEREVMLKNAQALLECFEKRALANVENFRKQKTSDITDILMNFIIMTIDRCKKSKTTWVNIKEACDAM